MLRSAKDVLAGLTFIGFGLAFAAGAMAYDIGDPVRMGPGFFPLVIGVLLAILGGVIAVTGSADEEPITAPPWRAAGLILGGIVVFGLTVRGLGLLPAIFLTALLAGLASRQTSPIGALLLAAALTVISVAIFVVALSVRLPLFGPWIRI